MIRLVTQFDLPASRPVHATPTCSSSSCCSCSCCVGTAVASLAFTAMDAQSVARTQLPQAARRRRWGAAALGGAALPLGLGTGALVGTTTGKGELLVPATFLVWLGLVAGAYLLAGKSVRSSLATTGLIALVAVVAATIEFTVGAGAEASVGYLVIELMAASVAIVFAYRVTR